MQDEFAAALKDRDLDAIDRLLDEWPELLYFRNEQGASALALCLYHGFPEAAERIIDRGRRPDPFEAAMLGRLDILAEVPTADLIAPDGFPLLSLAVFFGQPEAFRYLLDKGADVNLVSKNAMRITPLHAAASRRDLEAIRLLLDRGADPNARQMNDWTPLHAAAAHGDGAIVELLLAHAADRHARTTDGLTPLDLARKHQHLHLEPLLIE